MNQIERKKSPTQLRTLAEHNSVLNPPPFSPKVVLCLARSSQGVLLLTPVRSSTNGVTCYSFDRSLNDVHVYGPTDDAHIHVSIICCQRGR